MNLPLFTPHELRIAHVLGRVLILVDAKHVLVTGHAEAGRKLAVDQIYWHAGPKGHAIIGVCHGGCHFVVEFPRMWRSRGKEIVRALADPPADHPCAGGCACLRASP